MLRLDLAQFRELQAFSQFGSDLDKATQDRLNRGQRLVEILKQGQYEPMAVEEQVVSIYTAVNGHLDDVDVDKVGKFELEFLKFIKSSSYKEILNEIKVTSKLDEEVENKLLAAIKEFKETFQA